MTDLTGRILILVGSATLRLALIATALVLVGGSRAVQAQESTPTASWGDVGVSVLPFFKAYLDVESCCTPLGGWVTWGTGKFRLQMDYVHNRRRYLDYPGYYEERQGQEIIVQRAYLDTHVEQIVGAALYWRVSEHSRFSPHVLLGFAYGNFVDRPCVAAGEPVVRRPARPHDPNELLYRVDFADGEEQWCLDEKPPIRFRRIGLQVGVGGDIPIGSRFFARVQARLIEVRIGVGLRF